MSLTESAHDVHVDCPGCLGVGKVADHKAQQRIKSGDHFLIPLIKCSVPECVDGKVPKPAVIK